MPLQGRVMPLTPAINAGYRLAQFGRSDIRAYDDGIFRLDVVNNVDPWRKSVDDAPAHFVARVAPSVHTQFFAGAGVNAGIDLGLAQDSIAFDTARHALAPDGLANPYLSLLDEAVVSGVAFDLGHYRFDMSGAFGKPFIPTGTLGVWLHDQPRAFAGDAGLSVSLFDGVRARFDTGALNEQGSLLGALGVGAGKIGETSTWFAGFSGQWDLTPNVSLIGDVYSGVTSATGAGSLLRNVSNVASVSGGVALVADNVFDAGDRMILGMSQPLRTVSGDAQFQIPDVFHVDGTVTASRLRLGVAADGQERDFEAGYARAIGARTALTGGVLLRTEPDNIASANAQGLLALRLDIKLP
jgi:hypothetical protein